ncbi:hypothetical protein GW17_00030962 [Ensete ventricosum]|nr:hypothetical protein GW17_00030962 [Ensete ventricosum]
MQRQVTTNVTRQCCCGAALAAQRCCLAAHLGRWLLGGRATLLTRYGQGLHYRQARLASAAAAPLTHYVIVCRPAATLFWLAG